MYSIRRVSLSTTPTLIQSSMRLFSSLQQHGSRRHFERRLLKYSTEQVYNIVADVNSYHKFVPWCKESRITNIDDPTNVKAELVVGFGVFNERYTSEVTLNTPAYVRATSVKCNLLDFLITEWKFLPASDPKSCWVTFQIDFKFKSDLYNHISEMFLTEVVNNMVKAFEGRCKSVYGNR